MATSVRFVAYDFDHPAVQSLTAYTAYCRSQARPPHSKASITFTLQGTVKQQFLHTIALEIYTLLDAGQQVSGESNEEAEKARNLATVLAMVFGTYLAGIKELDGGVTTDSGEVLKRSVRANKPRCGYWVEAMEKAEKEYRADGDVEFRSTASTNSSRKAAAGPSTGGSSRSTTPSTARSVPPTDSSSVQTNQKVDDGEDQAGASLKGFAAAMSGLTLGSGKQASSIAPTKQ
jgi:hypothetical protein